MDASKYRNRDVSKEILSDNSHNSFKARKDVEKEEEGEEDEDEFNDSLPALERDRRVSSQRPTNAPRSGVILTGGNKVVTVKALHDSPVKVLELLN